MMKAVRRADTRPELQVRKLVASVGVRYRVRNRDLPGSPDLANRTRHWALFVNGCFWHGHKNCPKTKGGAGSRVPNVRDRFWKKKRQDKRGRGAAQVPRVEGSRFSCSHCVGVSATERGEASGPSAEDYPTSFVLSRGSQ